MPNSPHSAQVLPVAWEGQSPANAEVLVGAYGPYMRVDNKSATTKAIIISANPARDSDVTLSLHINISALGMDAAGGMLLTDLWNGDGNSSKTVTSADLMNLSVFVKRDMSPRGGLSVLKLELLH